VHVASTRRPRRGRMCSNTRLARADLVRMKGDHGPAARRVPSVVHLGSSQSRVTRDSAAVRPNRDVSSPPPGGLDVAPIAVRNRSGRRSSDCMLLVTTRLRTPPFESARRPRWPDETLLPSDAVVVRNIPLTVRAPSDRRRCVAERLDELEDELSECNSRAPPCPRKSSSRRRIAPPSRRAVADRERDMERVSSWLRVTLTRLDLASKTWTDPTRPRRPASTAAHLSWPRAWRAEHLQSRRPPRAASRPGLSISVIPPQPMASGDDRARGVGHQEPRPVFTPLVLLLKRSVKARGNCGTSRAVTFTNAALHTPLVLCDPTNGQVGLRTDRTGLSSLS